MPLNTGLTIDPTTQSYVTEIAPIRRATSLGETFERNGAAPSAITIVSGTQTFTAIQLTAGTVVSKITFQSNTTALATGTHQFFSLYSAALAKLGVTSDDLAVAWAASTEKTLSLATPYTVLADGIFYIGCMVAASTPPTINGLSGPVTFYGTAPAVSFIDSTNTGLTIPSGSPATAVNSAGAAPLWGWVS